MMIRHSTQRDIPPLKVIWKEAFNDTNGFIEGFFSTAYKEDHSLLLQCDNKIASMLFWFDCSFNEKKVAYIYAVATFKEFQKRGLCNALMNELHSLLKASGYVGACLVPSDEHLFNFYGKMGYINCIYNSEKEVFAEDICTDITEITVEEYLSLRKKFLPKNSVTQRNTEFLKFQAKFYKGDDVLFSARKENDTLFVFEFFGSNDKQSSIVNAQKAKKGIFRTLGTEKPFAMYLPFEETELPVYLDFAYD